MGRESLRTKEKDAQCSHHLFAASIIKAEAVHYLIDKKKWLARFCYAVSK